MLSAIRRGPALARALRVVAPSRTALSKQAFSPASWHQLPCLPFSLQTHSLHISSALRSAQSVAEAHSTPNGADVYEPFTEFQQLADRGLVDSRLITAITKDMNINQMTDVQKLTIAESLRGGDVLGQAKTGTGKTLAFLLPVLQNILKDPEVAQLNPSRRRGRYGPGPDDVRAVIISPTRELAEQIAVEARKVAARTGLVVQTAVGGTLKTQGLRRIQQEGCHVLVATPGRLKDILSDPASGVSTPKLATVVLDEADRLLEVGFADDIVEIRDLLQESTLPELRDDQQTLMFSATVPQGVMRMVRRTLRPGYTFLKTVKDNEIPVHMRVQQSAIFLNGYENAYPAVLEIAKRYIHQCEQNPELPPFKAIVYFNTTIEVQFACEAFQNLRADDGSGRPRHPLGRMFRDEIHSRLSQAQRTRAADNFRKAKSGILFSSDVTARGMDFPDVTHIIQVGLPQNRETYVHRLGRTARANKGGEGWLLMHDLEYRNFRQYLGDLPIQEDQTSIMTATVDMSVQNQQLAPQAAETLTQMRDALAQVPYYMKAEAYKVLLSANRHVGHNVRDHARALNNLAVNGWQLKEAPDPTSRTPQARGSSRGRGVRMQDDGDGFNDMLAHTLRRNNRAVGRQSGRFDDRQSSYGRGYGNRRSDDDGNNSRPSFNSRSSMPGRGYDRRSDAGSNRGSRQSTNPRFEDDF